MAYKPNRELRAIMRTFRDESREGGITRARLAAALEDIADNAGKSAHAANFDDARVKLAAGDFDDVLYVHVACHTTLAGGGGGVFDVYPVGSYVDDNGWTIVAGTAALVRRGASTCEVNPRDFGALGDDTHDDIANILTAKAKIASGGTLLFPNGVYRITAPIPLLSGQTIKGMSGTYHGPCRIHIVTKGEACVTIGDSVIKAGVDNIALEGTGTLTVNADPELSIEYDDSYGIKMEGTYPNSSYQHTISRVQFYQLGTGIYCGGTTIDQWQCDNVSVDHCNFNEVGHSIHLNTQNSDYWELRNCGLTTSKHDGVALRFERSGFVGLYSCAGGGLGGTGTFIRTEIYGPLSVINTQCENAQYTLDVAGPGADPITLTDCVCDALVMVRTPCHLQLIGGRVTVNLTATNTARISNIGCAVADYTLSGNSLVAIESFGGIAKRFLSENNPSGFPVETTVGGFLLTTTGNTTLITAYALPAGNFRIDSYFEVVNAPTVVTVSVYNDSPSASGGEVQLLTGTFAVGRHLVPSCLAPIARGVGTGGYVSLKATASIANNVRVYGTIDAIMGAAQ